MSMLNRFSGVLRQTLSRQSSVHNILRSVSSSSFSTIPQQRFYSTTTSSSPCNMNTIPIKNQSTSTALQTEQQESNEITSVSTSPSALPVGYIDDYHNHGHRYMPGDPTKRAFTYLILGTTQFIAASAARVAILKLIYTMSASADVLALGSVEVDLGAIPLGESATIKWRGKPVFIRHRTQDEIALAAKDDLAELRHSESDISRVQKPQWLVVLGVCTHLGCVPIANAGDYHGWFCPCHGSHYDVSGRIRKGPAPLNLEVPSYRFIEDDTKMILG